MDTPTLKTESGFTFLEVMIAFSIMALVLVTIFQLHSQNIALGVRARFNSIAPTLAEMKTTELISSPDDLSSSDNGDFGDDYIGYLWQSEISDVESEYLDDTIVKRLKKIDVYVEAEDTSLSYHLRTFYLFDEEP
jgi:general secretion pathway protein I